MGRGRGEINIRRSNKTKNERRKGTAVYPH